MTNNQPQTNTITNILNYKEVKDHLLIRFMHLPNNLKLLNSIPHLIMGDILITYHILIKQIGDYLQLAEINNGMFEIYNISLQQLHNDALISTQKLQPCKIMRLAEATDEPLVDAVDNPMHVITNQYGFNGSVVILYNGVLDSLSKKLNDDLSLIPLSANEWIVAPETFAKEKHLHGFVELMNITKERSEEFLSEHMFHYDKEDKLLETEEDFIERIKEKVVN